MSDMKPPEQYVLGNTIIMQVQWTNPESGELLDSFTPAQMTCQIRHEDDPNPQPTSGPVREGIGPGLYEASHYPDHPGIWYYSFILEIPPVRVVQPGSFEIINNDTGLV